MSGAGLQKKAQSKPRAGRLFLRAVIFCVISWVFAFRGFLSGALKFRHDALPYYEHGKFFIDYILRGIFPLWDPTWNCGVPNEFFLRRMGDFNPFYYVVAFLRLIGFSHFTAYNIFLVAYYFLGMIGFYLLCQRIFKNAAMSLFGFFLLSFSSLATLVFSSYVSLIFTPGVWFFYFLVSFYFRSTRTSFLGAIFALMILFSTYIPFYFLFIFSVFLFFSFCLMPGCCVSYISKLINFFKQNKGLVFCSVLILLFSLIPAWQMFQSSAQGNFVLPTRNFNSSISNAIGVPQQRSDFGGIIPHYVIKELFSSYKSMTLARVYIPLMAFIVLLLGGGVRASKRLLLFVGMASFLFLVGVYDAPVYKAFFKHIFFFKYLRNFQFFFWVAILPLFILICCEHFSSLKKCIFNGSRKYFMCAWVVGVHIGCVLLFYFIGLSSTNLIVLNIASCLFFILLLFFKLSENSPIMIVLMGALVIVPSFEIYQYLGQNALLKNEPYRYEQDYQRLQYHRSDAENPIFVSPIVAKLAVDLQQKQSADLSQRFLIYYGTRWYNQLLQNINQFVFKEYIRYKFIAYDSVEWVDAESMPWEEIETSFSLLSNKAYVERGDHLIDASFLGNQKADDVAQVMKQDSKVFKLKKISANFVQIQTDFDQKKFLVFTDCYYPGWRVFINGRKQPVFRANGAFKGVWLPAGFNEVEYKFGSLWDYGLKGVATLLFFLMLFLCLFEWRRGGV